MDSPTFIYVTRWLVRETFLQAVASKIFWIFLLFSLFCTVFCLGISMERGDRLKDEGELYPVGSNVPLSGPNPHPGKMHLLFGAFKVPLHRDGEAEVHMLQIILGTWVAGTAGVLFLLVGTAAFLPDFLQPATAAVLLAKPIPRWLLVAGKYLGVVAFVFLQALIFFFTTWFALGIKTGHWPPAYLAGVPLLVLQFAPLYAVSVLLAVSSRSTLACVVGSILLWGLAFAMNYARHSAIAMPTLYPDAPPFPEFTLSIIDLGYLIMPKPADLLMFLEQAIGAAGEKATLTTLPEMSVVWEAGQIDPLVTISTTIVFCVVVLALAGWQLANTDY